MQAFITREQDQTVETSRNNIGSPQQKSDKQTCHQDLNVLKTYNEIKLHHLQKASIVFDRIGGRAGIPDGRIESNTMATRTSG